MTRITIVCGVVLASGAVHAENVVRGIDVRERGDRTEVLVRGASAPTFTTYKLGKPTRVVVDIANARLSKIDSPIDVDTWAVSQVAVQQFRSDDRAIARVMVGLKRECSYDVRADGHDIRIAVDPAKRRPPSADEEQAARERARAESALAEVGRARADADRAGALAKKAMAAAEREREAAKKARSEAAEARRTADQLKQAAASTTQERAAAEEAKRAAHERQRVAEKRLARAEEALRDARALRQEAEDQVEALRAEAGRQANMARSEADRRRESEARERRARENAEAARRKAEAAQRETETAKRETEAAKKEAEAARKEAEAAKKSAEAARKKARAAKRKARAAGKANETPQAKQPKDDGKAQELARITDVTFADDERAATITVRTTSKAHWAVLPTNGRSAMLELRGVSLMPELERKMDTSGFEGPVRAVSTYRVDESGGRVRLVAELKGDPTHHVVPTADGLRWVFDKPQKVEKPAAATSYAPTRVGAFSSAPLAAPVGRPKKAGRYSGRRIDLDFKDADIQNLLRLLSDVGEVNIVTSDDVKGQVTIRMRNVPWDQALDVILRSKSLGQVREGNLIRVAPLAVLQKERDEEIARLKQVEELKPIETRLVPLSYAKAADVVQRATDFLSVRGKVSYDERTNQIVARDTAERLDVIEQLVRELDTQTPQVTIEARIIEANTNFVRELGVQWGGDITSGAATGNPTGLVFPNEIGVGGSSFTPGQPQSFVPGAVNPNFAVNLPAGAGEGRGGSVGLHMGSVSGTFNLNLRLSAAEDTDQVRILSAPKVTTLDNHKATVTSGVSIPFSTVSAQGTQTILQDAVLGLTVTPHVTADGSVVLDLDITKSEPGSATPQGQLTITKKTAKTEMLVKDGDTAVIGGIYTRTTGTQRRKVPWFADLPILGYFFRHTSERDNRSEVLVFITPRIVNRAVALGR